ncbi:MAG: ABC transporter ATP-binding protein [Candidatus Odinarchaeota archaeon]|nr:ABC transporter ATP-binding protein [Candidatus Odinarchaeota archaeon]
MRNNDSNNSVSLVVKNVTKVYEIGKVKVEAVRNVNLKVKKGEIIALVGPSGSGKTTLLNLIGTLDKPTEGTIFIDGIDVTKMPESELTKLRRRKIGFVFQFFNLIPVLTAFENVELPMLIAGVDKREREQRARQLLKLVGLEDRMSHKPDELSGGEQQRVAIARALANNPSLLLADEPTGDLDSKTGQKVIELMFETARKRNATTIMVTHNVEIAKLADKILKMRDGQIVGELH